ncbi:MAG TPA: UDP-N-acetylglucosamine--N-acetylmuramyl-(pentapeptide) pyrophosphoryl-undecaprenol N-acetylglucosamine transferase [Pirellulales bacterium]|nr:UDP-N-acetylglucosamine--N-acetylmuramyl-(pentapeptide) pyrophosphoryl-undecaprenol N-acetylglucosamine transferase [Pirellulales bacterium]
MTIDNLHVVFAGGGTGGHLFPGLAVAEQLQVLAPSMRITMATGGKPLENAQVAAAGFDHIRLPSHPLTSAAGTWRFVKDNLSGYRRARTFLRHTKVLLVVGLGGYASVPMAWAAASARIPLVLLEQNAFPGRVTRWLAPRASLVCAAFGEVRPLLKAAGPIRVTGNPIRSGFLSAAVGHRRRASSDRQLMILGGSGGSRTLNEQVPRALYRVQRELIGWRIVHQTGPRDWEATSALYGKLRLEAQVVPFIERIQSLLSATDLAVCRSGGTTLAELAAAGVPALLLPYPNAANNHQRKNADVYAAAGAGHVIDAREVSGRLDRAIAEPLAALLMDSKRRQQMANAMHGLARPNAAWHVATMISQMLAAEAPAHAAVA